MGHVKEPTGVDLNVSPIPLLTEDRQALSAIIAQYKLTKEIPQSSRKKRKASSKRKIGNVRARNKKTNSPKGVSASGTPK